MKLLARVALLLLVTPMASLAATATYHCDYQQFSDKEGLHEVSGPFVLTFIVDLESRKTYMVGNNGSSEVHVIDNADAFTFIEITDTGNVMTTTITTAGDSVHSRNSVVFGDVLASQYYGSCDRR